MLRKIRGSRGGKILAGFLLLITTIAVSVSCSIRQPENSGQLVDRKDMPDVMKELAQNELTEWMAGMWVELSNCVKQADVTPGVEAYFNTDDLVRASVTLQNGLEKVQPYYFMILADGIPVEFEINGSSYMSYALDLTAEQVTFDVKFKPEFSLNLGRLDFLLFFDGNPKSDHHMTTYTIQLRQVGVERLPESVQKTVLQRDGVKDSFDNGSYGAWLWNEDMQITTLDHIGSRDITIYDGETLLFESIAFRSGLYRTVLILDGQPLSFTIEGELYSWLDWRSSGTDMLQIPIKLSEDCEKSGSFFAVSTPIDTESLPLSSLASAKIQVVVSQAEEE